MRALQSGDGADHFPAVAIQHLHAGAMRDVQTVCPGICGNVVPAAFATNLPLRDEVVGSLGQRDRRYSETQKSGGEQRRPARTCIA